MTLHINRIYCHFPVTPQRNAGHNFAQCTPDAPSPRPSVRSFRQEFPNQERQAISTSAPFAIVPLRSPSRSGGIFSPVLEEMPSVLRSATRLGRALKMRANRRCPRRVSTSRTRGISATRHPRLDRRENFGIRVEDLTSRVFIRRHEQRGKRGGMIQPTPRLETRRLPSYLIKN